MPIKTDATNPYVELASVDPAPPETGTIIQLQRYDWITLAIEHEKDTYDDVESGGSISYKKTPYTARRAISTIQDVVKGAVPSGLVGEDVDTRKRLQEGRAAAVQTEVGILSAWDASFGTQDIKNCVDGDLRWPPLKNKWLIIDPSPNERTQIAGSVFPAVENTAEEGIRIWPMIDKNVELVQQTYNGGAFCLRVEIEPAKKRTVNNGSAATVYENPSVAEIVLSDNDENEIITIRLEEDATQVTVITDKDNTDGKGKRVDLPFKSKDGATRSKAYDLAILPVWNGILITNQRYDNDTAKHREATYVPYDPKIELETEIAKALKLDTGNPTDVATLGNPNRKFPTAAMALGGGPDAIELTGTPPFISLSVRFKNCGGVLLYKPLYFTYQGAVADIHKKTATPISEKVIPIFCRNGGGWLTGCQKSTSPDSDIYSVKWRSGTGVDERESVPFQTWGYISYRVYNQATLMGIKNRTGTIPLGGAGNPSDENILQVSISRTLEGTSGQIVFDQYPDGVQINQKIGAIQVDMAGGENTRADRVFSGIAWGASPQMSSEAFNNILTLKGLDQKMEDIRVLDAPPFDAYDHRIAMAYLLDLAGIAYDASDALEFQLKSTSDPQVWAEDFQSGTPIKDCVNALCDEAQYVWYITKNGTLKHVPALSQPSTAQVWTYGQHEQISFEATIDISHLANVAVLLSEIGGMPEDNEKAVMSTPPVTRWGQVWWSKVDIPTNPTIPWSRWYFKVIPGVLTFDQFIDAMTAIAERHSSFRWTGSMTVPGNGEIELLDSVVVMGEEFLVVGIQHNLDTQAKVWTTGLQLELKMF